MAGNLPSGLQKKLGWLTSSLPHPRLQMRSGLCVFSLIQDRQPGVSVALCSFQNRSTLPFHGPPQLDVALLTRETGIPKCMLAGFYGGDEERNLLSLPPSLDNS